MNVKAKFIRALLGRVLLTLPAVGLVSCNHIYDDLSDCPIELRFIYEYNMEWANAFHNQVDCLTAYYYDEDGNFVMKEAVTDAKVLSDESFRLRPALAPGRYHVVAYGGMECEKASFSQLNEPTAGSHISDLRVKLDDDCLKIKERMRLHNQFYGVLDFTVHESAPTYATVPMMRNTNSIQIALQHVDGSPIDVNDFVFEIFDDNNDFDYKNNLLPTGEIKYTPWNTENRSTGIISGRANEDWSAALAQFTTSRLVYTRSYPDKKVATTLRVSKVEDGEIVFEVPLVNYMLMFKDGNVTNPDGLTISPQEYLDRENSWNFVFFLDNNLWISTHIIVNDWEVRLNQTDF